MCIIKTQQMRKREGGTGRWGLESVRKNTLNKKERDDGDPVETVERRGR